MSGKFTCPVCFWAEMDSPPQDYNICSRCGTEFGYDDASMSHAELRKEWEAKGCPFFFKEDDRP